MISAGCVIEGEVVNSVLAPGVMVAKNAVVRDSIIFADAVIEQGAVVDLAILDKRVRIAAAAVVGMGNDKKIPNHLYPKHLYTGITLIGKDMVVPENTVIGRNCILQADTESGDIPLVMASGATV